MIRQEQPRQPWHDGPGERTRDPAQDARDLWQDAQATARSAAASQQSAAARSLGDFAGVLRQASRVTQDQGPTVARVAGGVADALEHLSSRLQSRDLSSLIRDVEDFARQQPLVFIGAAVLTGFVATRLLKSDGTSLASSLGPDGPRRGPAESPTAPPEPASVAHS